MYNKVDKLKRSTRVDMACTVDSKHGLIFIVYKLMYSKGCMWKLIMARGLGPLKTPRGSWWGPREAKPPGSPGIFVNWRRKIMSRNYQHLHVFLFVVPYILIYAK